MKASDGETGPSPSLESVRSKLYDVVRSSLGQFRVDHPQPADGAKDLRFTLLMTWPPNDPVVTTEEGEGTNVNVYMHTEPLPPIAQPPVVVEVRGSPRSNALAKDSRWVTERAPLEAARASDVNELLLEDDQGQLLEGSQTNFFAVKDGTVYTAGEGVLEGTVRDVVLKVCEANGIPVVLKPPMTEELMAWEGAFITSTSRLVLKINVVSLPLVASPVRHDLGDQPLVDRIQSLVQDEMRFNSTPMDP